MAFVRQEPPRWFWRVSQALTLWAIILCFLGIRRFLFGAGPLGLADPFRHDVFDHLPGWSNYVYVIAAGFGLLGGLALLNRAVAARWLFVSRWRHSWCGSAGCSSAPACSRPAGRPRSCCRW